MTSPPAERAWSVRVVAVVSAVAAVFIGALVPNSPHYFSGFLPRRLEVVVLVILGVATLSLVVTALARAPSLTVVRGYAFTLLALNWVVAASPKLTDPPPGNYILYGVTILACCIAAVTMRVWPAAAVIVGTLVPLLTMRTLELGLPLALLEAAALATYAVVVRFVVDLMVKTYDGVEEADRSQAAAAVRQSVEAVKGAERERWNRLIHDKVLAALLLASRGGSETVRASARELAADALDSLSEDDPETFSGLGTVGDSETVSGLGTVGDSETVSGLGVALVGRARAHGVEVRLDATVTGSPPPEVVSAVLEAAEEAYRNIARHAGTHGASTRVRVEEGLVDVEIRDDGVGFRPERVNLRRLGVRRSIPGPLEGVGGQAAIVSEPGHGTTVTLRWQAQPEPEPELSFDGYVPLPLPWPALPYLWVSMGIATLLLAHAGRTPTVTVCAAGALMLWGYRAAQNASNTAGWVSSAITLTALLVLALSTEPARHSDPRYWMAGMTIPLLVNLTLTGRFAPAWALAITANLSVDALWGAHGIPYLLSAMDGMSQMVLSAALGSICSVALRRATLTARDTHRRTAALNSAASAMHERTAERQRRIAALTREIIPTLTTIASGQRLTTAQRAEAAALEMAARDSILAPHVVDENVAAAAAHARRRAVKVTLWEGPERAQPHPDTDVEVEVERFRRVVVEVLNGAPDHSEVTIRWKPGTADQLATIAVDGPVPTTIHQLLTDIVPQALVDLNEDGLWLEMRSPDAHVRPTLPAVA